jgi:hypothetical protein
VIPAAGPLYCPYCYESFPEERIQFRCPGLNNPSGQVCAPEIDTVLRDRIGFAGALPPTFPANGRRTSARCPRCGCDSTTRVCPVCHSQLPVHFGKVRSRLIALVGARESGKTVFMTVLVHELMHQLGQRLDAAISGADDSTRHRFASEYERPLYRNSLLLAPTTTAGLHNRVPLVFRFTTVRRRLLAWPGRPGRSDTQGRGEPQHTLLSFFDTAGEDLRSQQSVEQNVRYLAAADGIVLVLDPLQMHGARMVAEPGCLLPTPAGLADQPATVLENITDLILAKKGTKPNERISKPLAIVFSKMDTLFHDLRETSPLRRPGGHGAYLDERDSLEVHHEIQRLLAQWEGTRIDQIARLHYRSYRYFGISALGETPTQDNHISARGIRPYRVADPFVWILAQLGAIPVKRG